MLTLSTLQSAYRSRKPAISARLEEFSRVWRKRDRERILSELCFCLMTPQSKAKNCWAAVERINSRKLLAKGTRRQVCACLTGVRFHNNKSGYIVEMRENFGGIFAELLRHRDVAELREGLVKNVKGVGYKEASHFLRNIGLGEDIAILDRHILKNMVALGVIRALPKTLNRNTYLELEKKLLGFSRKSGIPASHLDLLFWSEQTGEIFK